MERCKENMCASEIPVCNIMGVNIAAINMKWLIEYLKQNIDKMHGNYICVSNVHTTVTAYEDEEYCRIQNGGIMAIPDGGPLSSYGRKKGFLQMERTTGPGLMEEMFKLSEQYGYRNYFYGATEDTLLKLKKNIKTKYPKLKIAGMYSPPFRTLSIDEDKNEIEMINQQKPDIVWVGLGAPKQERWMAAHKDIVDGLMIGVGAGFDYHAGNIKRAPQWMQKCNLEWLFRLMQNPKKLFKRYLYTNTRFLWWILCGR